MLKDLEKLYKEIQECKKCELCELEINRRKLCPRIGKKRFLIVSQNPSCFRNPDETNVWGGLDNLPLSRLEKFLIDKGFLISDFFITNVIKCSFQQNIVPINIDEIINKCGDWLLKEISIINPKFILVLGKIAAKFFNIDMREKRLWNFIPVFATYHPSYVVRTNSYDDFFKIFEEALKYADNS